MKNKDTLSTRDIALIRKSTQSFMIGAGILLCLILDAYFLQFITGIPPISIPTWVLALTGVGLLLQALGASIMRYAVESKKLEPSDTISNLFFRGAFEIIQFIIYFALLCWLFKFASSLKSISCLCGSNMGLCNSGFNR